MKKWLVVIIVVILVGGAIAALKMKNSGPKGVEVETEAVARRTVTQTVNATGKIQPMTQVNISADVSAKITRLDVKEGDWVEQGAFLLQLDSERYQAAVESAQANLSAALANVNLAKENMIKADKDYQRTVQLHERNLESEASLDAAYAVAEVEKARHQSAVDQGEQARAALKQAQDDLSKTTIYAPMAGTISRLNKEVGEIALGSQFQEDVILEISNLEGMEALVDVDENDIVSVALGDEAAIEVDALPDMSFKGQVTEIANSAKVSGEGTTDQKTEFEVKIAVTEPGTALRPGMTASADIVTDVREEALSVPIQAVAVRTLDQLGAKPEPPLAGPPAGNGDTEGTGEAAPAATEENSEPPRFVPDDEGFVEIVWVISDDKAEARQVKTGIQGGSHIEIVEGLEEGEQVAVGSYRAISRDLEDGATVVLQSGPGNGGE